MLLLPCIIYADNSIYKLQEMVNIYEKRLEFRIDLNRNISALRINVA